MIKNKKGGEGMPWMLVLFAVAIIAAIIIIVIFRGGIMGWYDSLTAIKHNTVDKAECIVVPPGGSEDKDSDGYNDMLEYKDAKGNPVKCDSDQGTNRETH